MCGLRRRAFDLGPGDPGDRDIACRRRGRQRHLARRMSRSPADLHGACGHHDRFPAAAAQPQWQDRPQAARRALGRGATLCGTVVTPNALPIESPTQMSVDDQMRPAHAPVHAPMTQFKRRDGELLVGGDPLTLLAARVGQTPFYAYDRVLIRERVASLRVALPDTIKLHYAMKANPLPALPGFMQ